PPTPAGVSVVLTASNANPVVDSIVTVTAVVTQNGQPVPDGTAVEFSATGGSFSATETVTSILRTTTNGTATVQLRATVAGLIRVQAAVGNVIRTVDVTFRVGDVIPPPPNTAPAITQVSPAIGTPAGGQRIQIIGKNFKEPVRVLFDTGGPLPVEAFVVSRTDTVIEVLTPSVDLGAGQQFLSDVIVITQAGTVSEQRAELADGFTFRNEQLTPRVSTATPNSGPVTGGTRVTIFGDGFQAPVQVLFGAAEARVVTVDFGQIIVEAPAGRDTADDGSGTVTGPVDITVRNINSQTATVLTGGFRYVAAIQITGVGPAEGPFAGGTRVTIDGVGFVAPVAVVVGGVAAQPISVSGTRIVAITSLITLSGCSDVSGETTVTNIVNGDTATGPNFTYRVPKPTIIGTSPSAVPPGGILSVIVANAVPGINRFTLTGLESTTEEGSDTKTVFPISSVFAADGTATFTLAVPTNFQFENGSCFAGGEFGERLLDLNVDVTYLNIQSGCTDSAEDVFTVDVDNGCVALPSPEITQITPTPPGCAIAPATTVGTPSQTIITFSNDGNAALSITPDAPTGANAAEFVITPATRVIAPGGSANFTVTFTPAAVGPRTASVTFNTNDTDEGSVTVCLQGTGL
ncbi:MAG TPA: IPT/TIG domain-containing protein, partial [Thermoanaerobaculia bacterium]|nr:IPT/TIG domain-containing protein [Thermoanaerobaculia bacterium]